MHSESFQVQASKLYKLNDEILPGAMNKENSDRDQLNEYAAESGERNIFQRERDPE